MYKITITKTATETKQSGHDWAVIGQRLVTEEDLKPSAYESRSEVKERLLAANVIMFEERGYTPVIEKEVVIDRMIFEQTVDDLDMTAVIRAINKIA